MRVSDIYMKETTRLGLTVSKATVASIPQALSLSAWDVASGSVVLAAMLHLPTSSIILSARDTRKSNFTRNPLSEIPSSNAITVVQRMFSSLDLFPQNPTPLLYFYAVNLVPLHRLPRI